MVQQLIRSIGSDGKEVLSNILDKDTGRYIQYKEIDNITDSDVDGEVYIRNGGKYYIQSQYLDRGKSLIKDSIEDLRNLTLKEYILLQIRYYENVQTLGYFTAGDGGGNTFVLDKDSNAPDNGGSIVKIDRVENGRLIGDFKKEIKAIQFGVMSANPDVKESIISAFDFLRISGINKIVFPSQKLNHTDEIDLVVNNSVTIDFSGCILNDISEYSLSYGLKIMPSDAEILTTVLGVGNAGDVKITLNDEVGDIGDLIVLRPETNATTTDYPGEVNKIVAISGSEITLSAPLKTSYNTGDNVLIVKPIKDLTIKDLNIASNGKPRRSLIIQNTDNLVINNINYNGSLRARIQNHDYEFTEGVRIVNSIGATVNNFYSIDHRYALFINNASSMNINNSWGEFGWHTFESTGCNWDIYFNNCHTEKDEAGFRSHWSGSLFFNNCYTVGGIGLYIDCVDLTVNNCRIIDAEMQITGIRPAPFGMAFRSMVVRNFNINGLEINAVDEGILWANETNTLRDNRFNAILSVRDVRLILKDGQYVEIKDFKSLKTYNLHIKSLEYFGAPVAQAVSFSHNSTQTNVEVIHYNTTIENVYHRVVYHNLPHETSSVRFVNLNVIGEYLIGGASTSRILEHGGLDKASLRIDGAYINIDGVPTMNHLLNITADNIWIRDIKYYKGLTTSLFRIPSNSSKMWEAENIYLSVNTIDVFTLSGGAKYPLRSNNIYRMGDTVTTYNNSSTYTLLAKDFILKNIQFINISSGTIEIVVNAGLAVIGEVTALSTGGKVLKFVPGAGVTFIYPQGYSDTTVLNGRVTISCTATLDVYYISGDLEKNNTIGDITLLSGYNASVAQQLTHDSSGVMTWVNI